MEAAEYDSVFMTAAPWVMLFVRVVLGVVILYYGASKISDLRRNADEFDEIGFKPGIFWGTLVAFIYFFGSIALILGVFARIAALLIGFEILVGALWKIRSGKPFTNYSYNLLILCVCLVLMVFGPGALSFFDPLAWCCNKFNNLLILSR